MPRKKKQEVKEEVIPVIMPVVEVDLDAMVKDCEKQALENGFYLPLRIDPPVRENYPRYGHGYVLHVRELSGKERMATVRYTHDAKFTFWQQDGMITG